MARATSRATFAFTGAEPVFYQSPPGIQRGFCRNCGTSICTIEDGDDCVRVTIATLDDPAAIAPGYQIWTDIQLHLLELADHLPRPRT